MQRYPYLKVQRCFQFSYLIYNISVSMFNFVDEIFSIFTRRAWCAAPRCWTTCRQDWCWDRRVASCSEAERRLTHSDTSALTVPAPPVIASLSVGPTHRILIISMIQSNSIFFLCPPSTSVVIFIQRQQNLLRRSFTLFLQFLRQTELFFSYNWWQKRRFL